MRPKRTATATGGPDDGRLLERLVAHANPLGRETLLAADLAPALDLLGELILDSPRPKSRPAYRRRALVLAAGVAALVASAVALGGMYTTHTGFFPSKAGTENDTSEFLRTDAPDFPPLVRQLVKDIPFPPGDSALARVSHYVHMTQPGPDGITQTVQAAGIKGTFSLWAVCAWRGYWLQEHAAGDVDQEALAANGLNAVASSQALKQVDSFWPLYLDVAKAESAGDPSAPKDFTNFYRVNCSTQSKPWATR